MLTLYDKHISLRVMAGTLADITDFDPEAPKISSFPALEASKLMAMSGFVLGPSGSDSGSDPAVNGDPNQYFGTSGYSGTLTPYRYLDDKGVPVVAEDTLWPLVVAKGSNLVLFLREGPGWDSDPVAGQEVSIFEATTDDPQPGDRSGFIKYSVPLAIQKAYLHKVIVADA
jgi:hypothetical protein